MTPQDDYVEALGRLHLTVSRAYRVNPEINFEVFIHKVDGLSDDHKIETQRDIHQRANDDLADASLEKLHLRLVLHLCQMVPIFESTALLIYVLFLRSVGLLTFFTHNCVHPPHTSGRMSASASHTSQYKRLEEAAD